MLALQRESSRLFMQVANVRFCPMFADYVATAFNLAIPFYSWGLHLQGAANYGSARGGC